MDRETAIRLAREAAERNFLELGELDGAEFVRGPNLLRDILKSCGYDPTCIGDHWNLRFNPRDGIVESDGMFLFTVTMTGDVYRFDLDGIKKL